MYRSQVEGLCGDFNGIAEDDFRGVQDGHIFAKAQDFGNHWKTSESCSNVDERLADWDPCEVCIAHGGPVSGKTRHFVQSEQAQLDVAYDHLHTRAISQPHRIPVTGI